MNGIERISRCLVDLMHEDDRRILLGEDVATGTMLGLAKAANDDPALADRVVATPLLPGTCFAHAGGLALAGLRPILILPTASALLEGFASLLEVCRIGSQSGGARTVPMLVIAPCGGGFGLPDDAGEAPHGLLSGISGLRVVTVSEGAGVDAALRDAAGFVHGETPTVLLIPRAVLAAVVDDSGPRDDVTVAAGVRRVRDGRAITVFAWGECVAPALLAVERTGVDATVVDVGCLQPLPRQAIIEAARDTGRIAIVHSGPKHQGLGAELAALLAYEAIDWIDGPIVRIGGNDESSLAGGVDMRLSPTVEQIEAALQSLAQGTNHA